MKSVLRKFLAVFLVSAILVSTTGVVIASHICAARKKADISFFEHKGCCKSKTNHCESMSETSGQLKKNCCKLSISYHKINVNAEQKSISKSFQLSLLLRVILVPGNYFFHQAFTSEQAVSIDIGKSGRDFLRHIRLLLI